MDNQEYAGFWVRVGAALIDVIIMMIVLYVPLMFIYGDDYWASDKFIYGFWDFMLGYVIPIIATIWFWLKFFGTPGKMALRLKIVSAATGKKMTLGQAIGRYFAYIVSFLPFCLGIIWVGIDKRKQGWHDKLAGTVVIRDTGKETVQFETEA